MHRFAFVVVVALVLASSAAAASDPWQALHRPLRVHPLAAGAACPVSKLHPLDAGRLGGLGDGPIYPNPSRLDAYGRKPGWLGSKRVSAWAPGRPKRPVGG